jgi:hypothetical protein
MPWPVLPLTSLLTNSHIAVTITLATLALSVTAIIICCTLLLFVIARRRGHAVVDALLPAAAHL